VTAHSSRTLASARNWKPWLAALFVLVGALRIVGTYRELSETVDEVAHIGAGMEWLARGEFTFELKHPPLARIAAAAGPYLLGVRSQGQSNQWYEGRRVLYADNAYLRNLTAARLGMLPFFMIAGLFIWRLGSFAFGQSAALGAVACFTMLPPVLGHFGVATTDGPMLAMFAAAVYALVRWVGEPNVYRGVWLGVAVALAVVSKLSAIPFLGATGVLVVGAAIWVLRSPASRTAASPPNHHDAPQRSMVWSWKQIPVSIIAGCVAGFIVAWAFYRFSIGTIRGIPMPLWELAKGIKEAAAHNAVGHPAYFLGKTRVFGVWYFFPVILLLKTPIAALLLAALGFALLGVRGGRTRDWIAWVPLAVVLAIVGVSMPAGINIGVRHVLPAYVGISLGVGVAWAWVWQRYAGYAARIGAIAITALLSASTLTVHPDYLSYFNALAGDDPSELVSDSDIDWGQDLFRLRDSLRTRNVDTLQFAYIGTPDISPIVGVPVKPWNGSGTPIGWVAVSETWYRRGQVSVRGGKYVVDQNAMKWLDSAATPLRVGKGIRVYRIEP
jgi:4-amino-4-deoxy-L-arabinose transferase-like glycosyltransferase